MPRMLTQGKSHFKPGGSEYEEEPGEYDGILLFTIRNGTLSPVCLAHILDKDGVRAYLRIQKLPRPGVEEIRMAQPSDTRYLWTPTRIGWASMMCERLGWFTNALMNGKNGTHRSAALWLAEPGNYISNLRT